MAEVDEAVRRTAFALVLRDGRPVEVSRLASSLPEATDPGLVRNAVDRLAASGHLDLDPAGAVWGSGGLTLGPGAHGLLVNGREYRTWCAYDAIGILSALGLAGSVSTRCGICRGRIALRAPLAAGPAGAERRERLWLATGGEDLRADFCAPTVLLCSPEHADAWAAAQGGRGRVLDLGTAWRLGAGAWAGYAREAARLGVG